MNRTYEEMTTLPMGMVNRLSSLASADRKKNVAATGDRSSAGRGSVTLHRNHVRLILTGMVDADDMLSIGYEYTDKRSGKSVSRRDIVKGGREFLRVERWRTDTARWGATLPYWDYSNLRQLCREMTLGYTLALKGKIE